MTRADRRAVLRRRIAWGILALALIVAAVAMLRPDLPVRVVHPARYATTGTARLPLDRYVAAARAVLGQGDRIDAIALPERGPVAVTAAPAPVGTAPPPPVTTLYLDPPTARVLEAVPGQGVADPEAIRPIAAAALSPDDVVAQAADLSRGATLRRLSWPTERSPDWTVTYAGGARVKVADDSGRPVAVPARKKPGIAATLARVGDEAKEGGGWPLALAGVAIGLAAGALFLWWRARR